MAVTIVTREDIARADALSVGKYLVSDRICRTPDGRLVREDQCLDGGTLLYRPGMEIPLEEARAAGLIPEVAVTPTAAPNPTTAAPAKASREKDGK
jgi:hypothetical protein